MNEEWRVGGTIWYHARMAQTNTYEWRTSVVRGIDRDADGNAVGLSVRDPRGNDWYARIRRGNTQLVFNHKPVKQADGSWK